MISSLVDGVLAVALLIAGLQMVSVHRTLKQLRAYHQKYQAAFEKTAVALGAVRALLSDANTRKYESSSTLTSLIKEARATIRKMEARMPVPDQERPKAEEQHAEPIKADLFPLLDRGEYEKRMTSPAIAGTSDKYEKRVTTPAVVGTSHAPFAFCRRVARPMVKATADG